MKTKQLTDLVPETVLSEPFPDGVRGLFGDKRRPGKRAIEKQQSSVTDPPLLSACSKVQQNKFFEAFVAMNEVDLPNSDNLLNP